MIYIILSKKRSQKEFEEDILSYCYLISPDFKIWAGIRIISLNVYSETMKAIKKGGHS